jgi:hypothetical protein
MEKMEFDEGKQEAEDITSYVEEVKQVEEVLYDPVDEIVVEDCCPAVCYVRSDDMYNRGHARLKSYVKYGVRSLKFNWAPFAQLYSLAETPQPPTPIPPHLGSYARALLVVQDRRHLFVTPCLKSNLRRHIKLKIHLTLNILIEY